MSTTSYRKTHAEKPAAGPDVPAWSPDASARGALATENGEYFGPPSDAKIVGQAWIDNAGIRYWIVGQAWIDNAGIRYWIAEDNGVCRALYGRGSGPPAPWTELPTEFLKFTSAQRALDRLGEARGWTPETPIPEDDPEPAPTRRRSPEVLQHQDLVQHQELDPKLIEPSPFQPRQSFDEAEIQQLAESIRTSGQVVPILVRPRLTAAGTAPKGPTRYELVDGERRLRAIKLIGQSAKGLPTIRAEVRGMSDAEARSLILVTAVQRRELTALEEARAYKALLDAGDYAGPTELAKALAVSQSQVSNLIGLLRLPVEPWQQWIAEGKLSAAHARAVSPWTPYPAVLEDLAETVRRWASETRDAPSAAEFRRAVTRACRQASRRTTGLGQYDYAAGTTVPWFEPTDAQREQLQIVEVPDFSGNGEARAFNCELFDRLQKAHTKTWLAKGKREEAKKAEDKPAAGGGTENGRGKGAKKSKPAPFDPAEQARQKSEWFENVLQWLIARAIPTADPAAVLRLLLRVALGLGSSALVELTDLYEAIGIKGFGRASERQAARKLQTMDPAELKALTRTLLAGTFWRKDDAPSGQWEEDALPAIAASVGVDLEAAWLDGVLAPHYAAWALLLTDGERAALAKQLGIEATTAEAIVESMPTEDSREVGPPLPKELAKMWKDGLKAKRGRGSKEPLTTDD